MNFRLFLAAAVLILLPRIAAAQTVSVIETEGAVTAVVQTPRGSYIETERGTFRLETGNCDGGICVTPDVIRGLPKTAPDGGLPDGKIATAKTGDIRKAWYGRPTERYPHGILGDRIEGGSLVAELANGKTVELVLSDEHVFEDLTPRLANLDNDPSTVEIVTTRSSQSGGAAVVVYGLRGGQLAEIAASSENGQPNRWIAIAAIQDGNVYYVRTPHINGRLGVLQFTRAKSEKFETNDIVTGVSNHIIGSRTIMSAIFADKMSGTRIALPSQDHRSMVLIGNGGTTDIPLPGPVDKAIIALDNILVTATEDGRLLSIKP